MYASSSYPPTQPIRACSRQNAPVFSARPIRCSNATTACGFSFSAVFNNASASDPNVIEARAAITRGQAVFNNKALFTSDLPGTERVFKGRFFVNCSTCHPTPNVDNLSEPLGFNIGVANAAQRKPDMPLYTLRNRKTGELIETQDPGIAMTTGLWQDIGRFKIYPGYAA